VIIALYGHSDIHRDPLHSLDYYHIWTLDPRFDSLTQGIYKEWNIYGNNCLITQGIYKELHTIQRQDAMELPEQKGGQLRKSVLRRFHDAGPRGQGLEDFAGLEAETESGPLEGTVPLFEWITYLTGSKKSKVRAGGFGTPPPL